MDRIKLSIINTKYVTKENVVICKIIIAPLNTKLIKRLFIGKAKCSPEDKFDFNKGKKLALARAEIKARKYYSKVFKRFLKYNEDYINIVKYFIEECDFQITHNKEYIKNLIESFDNK